MTGSRTFRIGGLLIAVSAVMLALAPFRVQVSPRETFTYPSPPLRSSCGPPVVDALRPVSQDGGWFGYVPLDSKPVQLPGHMGCRQPARDRLGISTAGMVLALVLGLVAMEIDRRRGYGWGPQLLPSN